MSAIFIGYLNAQNDCKITAVGLHYIIPKGASIEISKFGRFHAGIGVMYNSLNTSEKGKYGTNASLDILTTVGVRVYHKEYRTAIYPVIGIAIGDLYGPRMWYSGKLMLLRNQKAINIEPFYCNKLGLRIGIYKII